MTKVRLEELRGKFIAMLPAPADIRHGALVRLAKEILDHWSVRAKRSSLLRDIDELIAARNWSALVELVQDDPAEHLQLLHSVIVEIADVESQLQRITSR